MHTEHGELKRFSRVDFADQVVDVDWKLRVVLSPQYEDCLGWVLVMQRDIHGHQRQRLFMVGPRVAWLSSWAAVEKYAFKGRPVAFCENE